MSERPEKPSEILGALPRTRPQRRSSKRGPWQEDDQGAPKIIGAARPANQPPTRRSNAMGSSQKRQAATKPHAQRPGTARRERPRPTAPPSTAFPQRRTGLMRTLVQAGAELAEIGLSVTARAVRDTVARLPRP